MKLLQLLGIGSNGGVPAKAPKPIIIDPMDIAYEPYHLRPQNQPPKHEYVRAPYRTVTCGEKVGFNEVQTGVRAQLMEHYAPAKG